MIKNLVLIVSIILLSLAMILFAYFLKDKTLCCGLTICRNLTNICEEDSSTNDLVSEKGVVLYLKDVNSGDTVNLGESITGEITGSWYFEGEFPVRILNENMEILGTLHAKTSGDWMTTELVPFEFVLNADIEQKTNIVLRFEKSNPSGLQENDDYIDVPLVLDVPADTQQLSVYFPNGSLGSTDDCTLVFPVKRRVQKTEAIGRAALSELIKGTTDEEEYDGFYTNINNGVEIQSLTIANGVATVDFNSKLEEGVGGSCLTESIRAQIEETLKQFPTVSSVVISIDGRVDDILQP